MTDSTPIDLGAFFANRKRAYETIEIQDHIPAAPRAKALVRVLTADEHAIAKARALEYLAELYKDKEPGADVTQTAIAAYALQMAFYQAKSEAVGLTTKHEIPLFENGRAVLRSLSAHELSTLFRLYEETATKAAGVKVDVSVDELTELTKSLALCSKEDRLTFGMLSRYERVELMELLIRTSMLLHPSIKPMGSESTEPAEDA